MIDGLRHLIKTDKNMSLMLLGLVGGGMNPYFLSPNWAQLELWVLRLSLWKLPLSLIQASAFTIENWILNSVPTLNFFAIWHVEPQA